jgi:hypothetical protein
MPENLYNIIATQSQANIYNYELSSLQFFIDANATDSFSSYDTHFLNEVRLFERVIVISSSRIMLTILLLIFWNRRITENLTILVILCYNSLTAHYHTY